MTSWVKSLDSRKKFVESVIKPDVCVSILTSPTTMIEYRLSRSKVAILFKNRAGILSHLIVIISRFLLSPKIWPVKTSFVIVSNLNDVNKKTISPLSCLYQSRPKSTTLENAVRTELSKKKGVNPYLCLNSGTCMTWITFFSLDWRLTKSEKWKATLRTCPPLRSSRSARNAKIGSPPTWAIITASSSMHVCIPVNHPKLNLSIRYRSSPSPHQPKLSRSIENLSRTSSKTYQSMCCWTVTVIRVNTRHARFAWRCWCERGTTLCWMLICWLLHPQHLPRHSRRPAVWTLTQVLRYWQPVFNKFRLTSISSAVLLPRLFSHSLVTSSADYTQSFDRHGHVIYGFLAQIVPKAPLW